MSDKSTHYKTPSVAEAKSLVVHESVTLPTIQELFSDDLSMASKQEGLNAILAHEPRKEWIKEHPYISGHYYLPIDKVEHMLRMIFKVYRIEITGQGTAFNGVWVTVRVHYFSPATNQMEYHDGIGAMQLQTKKGSSPADLANINSGAISMAFPIAKSLAIKDACDMFGNVFGANLNRRDVAQFKPDLKIIKSNKEKLEGNGKSN